MTAMLKINNLNKMFGGISALTNVTLAVEEGEIFALVGPNGSGKSTLFNCINRLYKPTSGSILFMGEDITKVSTPIIAHHGIARTFQNVEIFPHLTTKENILVGMHRHITLSSFLSSIFREKSLRVWNQYEDEAFKIMDFLGISRFHCRRVDNLAFGLQKVVEIGRALACKPKLLLLDEPTSGLNEQETIEITRLVKEINSELGITVMIIEHNINMVKAVADMICVLNNGRVIVTDGPEEVTTNRTVIEIFLGEKQSA